LISRAITVFVASSGTKVIAESVDAEAVVYASDVVKMRLKWVYYALGALAIVTILAWALGMGITQPATS
jgi:uncharacterized membrane protein